MSLEKLGYDIRFQIFTHLIPRCEIHYALQKATWKSTPKDQSSVKPKVLHGMAIVNKEFSEEFLDFVYKHVTFAFPIKSSSVSDFRFWPVSTPVLQRVQICRFIDAAEATGLWGPPKELRLASMPMLLPSLRRMELEVFVNPNVVKEDVDLSKAAPHACQSTVTPIFWLELAKGDPSEATYAW